MYVHFYWEWWKVEKQFFQCYEVFLIHNIDAICHSETSNLKIRLVIVASSTETAAPALANPKIYLEIRRADARLLNLNSFFRKVFLQKVS